MSQTKINCPNCATEIDVNSILYQQLQSQLQSKFNADLEKLRSTFKQQQDELEKERADFEKKKQRENELFQQRLEARLKEEKRSLESLFGSGSKRRNQTRWRCFKESSMKNRNV